MLGDPLDWLQILARMAVYASTLAMCGAVFFRWSFPRSAARLDTILTWQACVGGGVLLLVEPIRYALFQLRIADGDLSLAFAPAMHWMGLETALGQAASVRLVGMVLVLASLRRCPSIAVTGALLVVAA